MFAGRLKSNTIASHLYRVQFFVVLRQRRQLLWRWGSSGTNESMTWPHSLCPLGMDDFCTWGFQVLLLSPFSDASTNCVYIHLPGPRRLQVLSTAACQPEIPSDHIYMASELHASQRRSLERKAIWFPLAPCLQVNCQNPESTPHCTIWLHLVAWLIWHHGREKFPPCKG